jgi:hypothetical protein
LGESEIKHYLLYIKTNVSRMKKTELKKLIKEAFLTEKKSNLLNENSPGFDNRKQGGALPTLESVKAAYQAKKLKEASAEEDLVKLATITAAVRDLDDAKKDAGLNEDSGDYPSLESINASLEGRQLTGEGYEELKEDYEQEISEEEEEFDLGDFKDFVVNATGDYFEEEVVAEEVENLKINDFFYRDIKEEMARQENQTLVTKDFLEKVKSADTVEKMRALFEDNDVEEVFDSINDDFIAAGGSGDEALDEADEYDPGALAKVGESTIYGTVDKITKLPFGKVEVEYDTGDVQVLEKENGTWIEVSYRKPGIRETIKRADTIIAEYSKLQTKK